MNTKLLIGFISGSLVSFVGNRWWGPKPSERRNVGSPQSTKRTEESRILKYGEPETFPAIVAYKNHILRYDQARKIPLWVAEHITANHVTGGANRRCSKFQPDPGVTVMFTAQNTDYWHSGWSRGHMAPAGNNKYDQDAMDQTFYLTNVLPQDLNNNADFWNRMEMFCRDLTKDFDDVWIVSGPLMLPIVDDSGKKYIKHQVIGENEVAVPTHLFKIIIAEKGNKSPLLGSFVVPNEPIPRDHKLEKYKVPLEFIERKSGFTFHPQMTRSDTVDLCLGHHCNLLGSDEFELYIINRKMSNANNLRRLDKVWSEIEAKNLKPDEYTQNTYNVRKAELIEKEKKEKIVATEE